MLLEVPALTVGDTWTSGNRDTTKSTTKSVVPEENAMEKVVENVVEKVENVVESNMVVSAGQIAHGVTRVNGTEYKAEICVDSVMHYLGTFSTLREAAIVR